ncbi:MAG: DUF1501 domain-containing protein [Planctomycetota bacterium]
MNVSPAQLAQAQLTETRRQFFGRGRHGLGAVALGSLLLPGLLQRPAAASGQPDDRAGGLPGLPHFAPRAKRVIYLLQCGAPSQVDLLDYKPSLDKLHATELPASVRGNQRLTGMTAGQGSFPLTKSPWKFVPYGQSGMMLSELLPHIGKVADELCLIKSMHTEAINHDPAITFFQTGNQQPGRPSIGSWLSYGLGSEAENLPGFVVLLNHNTYDQAQPIYDRLWGAGFLPSNHQGVKFRSQGDPVLYLQDPAGTERPQQREFLDRLGQLNAARAAEVGDPEILARIAQYEMAYRMQMSVPELTDLSDEPASTFELYGEEARTPGTNAANCLLARRLAERGVRFIQIFNRDWDHHSNVKSNVPMLCKQTDQGSGALIQDLKQRGMLDDTLVIWGGEFGRTVYSQGGGEGFGRDHHPRCFSIWMAGGGVKAGFTFGSTDDFCYNIVDDPVHVHDFHATIGLVLGIDHEGLSVRFLGRDYRLTVVNGQVVEGFLR